MNRFIGNWKLTEWINISRDGKVNYPFGKDAAGIISYDDQANMAVQIMKKERPLFASEDPLQAKPEEVIAAFISFMAYSGKYEVDVASSRVIHHIKLSSFPNWVGQDQVRYYEFQDNHLILSTNFIGESRHKLTWKKNET